MFSFREHGNIELWSLDDHDRPISCRMAIAPHTAELPPNDEEGGLHTLQGMGILSQPFIGLNTLEAAASEEYREEADWYWAHKMGDEAAQPRMSEAG